MGTRCGRCKSMPSERPTVRLVADAYDAAVEPRRWPAFLEHLAAVIREGACASSPATARSPRTSRARW
jgi:hypothetical protein